MILRVMAFISCKFFFKRISISGTPYAGKSALWVANHSSGIVDPAVIVGFAPVPIRPLAKNTLWEVPMMRVFLKLGQAIPITRVQDMKKDIQAQKELLEQGQYDPDWRIKVNNEAFQTISNALIKGDCILVFPEGVSHDDPHLYQFKTGVARMALQALSHAENPGFSIVVQPVIIDYSEKDEFRSELCIHYCEPIPLTSEDLEDSSVKEIMNSIRESMEEGFASFFSWDEKRNWRSLFEIAYGRTPYSAREFRIFVERYRPEFDTDAILLARIQTMRRFMQTINLTTLQLMWGEQNEKKRVLILTLLRHGILYIFITFPIQLLGAVVWVIPSKMCEILADNSTSDRDVRATMKIANGMWFFPAWAFLMSSLLTFLAGDYLPNFNKAIMWIGFLILTPTFLVVSLLLAESMNLFPGFMRLSALRFFFPRGWRELMSEWRDISHSVVDKIRKIDENLAFQESQKSSSKRRAG